MSRVSFLEEEIRETTAQRVSVKSQDEVGFFGSWCPDQDHR